jgi:hypothetical protein
MIKRSPPPKRRTAVKRKRATARRVSVLRDAGYLEWLRDRRCVACVQLKMIYRDRLCASGSMPIDPAHGPVNGARSKGPDNEAIPLCRHHHEEQHRIGWPAFQEKYGFSREKEAATHYLAYQLSREPECVR